MSSLSSSPRFWLGVAVAGAVLGVGVAMLKPPPGAPAPAAARAEQIDSSVVAADFPRSRADLVARLRKSDPDMAAPGPWLPAPKDVAERNARMGVPPRWRASLDHGRFLDVNAYASGSLREVMIDVPERASKDVADNTIIHLVHAAAPNESADYARNAIETLNEARASLQIGRFALGGVWVGVYPGLRGAFHVWAVPGDKQELAWDALNRAMLGGRYTSVEEAEARR